MVTRVSQAVIRTAVIVGAMAFAIGFIATSLLSPSNLGPLFSILVTGPLGLCVGALGGIISTAPHADSTQSRTLLTWLGATWILTLIYTLFALSLSTRFGIPAVAAQLLVLLTTIVFFYRAGVHSRFPHWVILCRPVMLAGIAVIAATAIFPPVTRPWWGLQTEPSTSAIPRFVFILDGRLAASRHVPLLATDKSALLLEWVGAAAIAILICFGIAKWARSPGIAGGGESG